MDSALNLSRPYFNSLTDTRCLETTESIVVDGANGVCGAPRHPELWQTLPTVGVFLLSLIAMSVWALLPDGPARKSMAYVLGAAFLISVGSGFWALLVVRADAPLKVAVSAAQLANLSSAIEPLYRRHKVIAMENRCMECYPAIVFAQRGRQPLCKPGSREGEELCLVPLHREWTEADGGMVLERNASHGNCRTVDSKLICGDAE